MGEGHSQQPFRSSGISGSTTSDTGDHKGKLSCRVHCKACVHEVEERGTSLSTRGHTATVGYTSPGTHEESQSLAGLLPRNCERGGLDNRW